MLAQGGLRRRRTTVVASVGQQHVGIDIVLGHQIEIGDAVVGFPGGQKKTDRKTLSVGPKVDFGREAAARTAKSLVLSPPFAPAAQWCARTMVLSIICSAGVAPLWWTVAGQDGLIGPSRLLSYSIGER